MTAKMIRGANEGTSRDIGYRITTRIDYQWKNHPVGSVPSLDQLGKVPQANR